MVINENWNRCMLWDKDCEKKFFVELFKSVAFEKLFYNFDKYFIAYWPKSYVGKTSTLQSGNAYIGNFTEKWVSE